MNNPKLKRLETNARELEERIESYSADFYPVLNAAVNLFIVKVDSLLNAAFADANKLPSFEEAMEIGNQLSDALLDAGFDSLAEKMGDDMEHFRELAVEHYSKSFGIAETFGGIDVTDLDAFVAFQKDNLLNLADARLVSPVRDAIIQSTIGGQSEESALADIKNVFAQSVNKGEPYLTRAGVEFTDAQIETLVSDGYRRHYRQTKSLKANDLGLGIIQYLGPVDAVTSEQCEFLMTTALHGAPGFYLVEEFTADLHPKLKEPPLLAGGHFNCRHSVDYVTYEYAVEFGWNGPKVGSIDDIAEG